MAEPTNLRITCTENEADIYILGPIGGFFDGGITEREFMDLLKQAKGVKQINVRINSPGGSVTDAQGIVTALRSHKAKINTFIDGTAASAASFIAMAGDTIEIAQHGLIMIHDPSGGLGLELWGNAGEFLQMADELTKYAGVLQVHAEMIANVYAARTGIQSDKIREMMATETWFGAEEALASKFVDRIGSQIAMAACAGIENFGYKNLPKVLAQESATPEEIELRKRKELREKIDSSLKKWRNEHASV